MSTYKPGQVCPISGQWEIIDLATVSRSGAERTVARGEVFPPTPSTGQGYRLADPTRH